MEERCRKISSLIQQRKKAGSKVGQSVEGSFVPPSDPEEMMSEKQLEVAIKQLEDQKNEQEKRLKKQVVELDKQILEMKELQDISEIRLREKDHELKIQEMKLKELKRQSIRLDQ